MKKNKQRKEVKKLPAGAELVKDFAKRNQITIAAVYMRETRGTNDNWDIVTFWEQNFVVPKSQKNDTN